MSCLCVLKPDSGWEVEETGDPPCVSPMSVMLSKHPSQDGDRLVFLLRNAGPCRAWQ